MALHALNDMGATLGADMTERDAVIKSERRPYGDGKLPDTRFRRVGQVSGGQTMSVNLDNRHIRSSIHTANGCWVSFAILQTNLDALGILDHVSVGQNVTVLPNNNSRALADRFFAKFSRLEQSSKTPNAR